MPILKPYDVRVKALGLSPFGKTVTKTPTGQVVFVDSMIEGEEGIVEVQYKRNGQLFGRLKRLEVISPSRVSPICPIHSSCGGCALHVYSYDKQLEAKEKMLHEQFEKAGLMPKELLPIIGMNDPLHYRKKIQVPFGKKDGKVIYGFYRSGTHDIIESPSCPIEDKKAYRILETVKEGMERFNVTPYDEKTGTGIVRHAVIRISSFNDEVLLSLVVTKEKFSGLDDLIENLISNNPCITSLYLNVNDRKTNVIMGERNVLLYGKERIEERLGDMSFLIGPSTFFQVNPCMAETLYEEAIKFASIKENDVVFDAYSGIGSIGLLAAKNAKKVVAVEVIKESVEAARENAKMNGVQNYEAIEGDATEWMEEAARKKTKVDVLFMDPPRKGATDRFIKAAISLKPSRVVYVSCNPVTLVRDLSAFSKDYEIIKVEPVDMFPFTHHVETVAYLSIKK